MDLGVQPNVRTFVRGKAFECFRDSSVLFELSKTHYLGEEHFLLTIVEYAV